MPLYERLMGLDEPTNGPRIPIHYFTATMGEFARGVITGAQAQTIIEAASSAPLSAADVTEAQALLATISGSATNKLARAKLIEDVLLLSELKPPGYDTPALIRTRLGV